MEEDLLRRAADLAERCERTATVTSTAFLTPAEQYALTNWARHRDCTLVLHGGGEGCERRAAFFLPFYLTAADVDPAEHQRAALHEPVYVVSLPDPHRFSLASRMASAA